MFFIYYKEYRVIWNIKSIFKHIIHCKIKFKGEFLLNSVAWMKPTTFTFSVTAHPWPRTGGRFLKYLEYINAARIPSQFHTLCRGHLLFEL